MDEISLQLRSGGGDDIHGSGYEGSQVDVVAFLGRFTLNSSRRVGEYGKVIAIEADPSHYEMLSKNLKLKYIAVTILSLRNKK